MKKIFVIVFGLVLFLCGFSPVVRAQNQYVTMNSIDLSAYSAEIVTIYWTQTEGGMLESTDALYFQFSGDGGENWSSLILAFNDDNPVASFSYQLPAEYLTDDFKCRLYLSQFTGIGEYCYIDNISIETNEVVIFSDDCSDFDAWVNGSAWTIYSGKFRGHN